MELDIIYFSFALCCAIFPPRRKGMVDKNKGNAKTEKDNKSKTGEAINKIIIKHKLTQKKLGEILGLHRAHINNIINGHRNLTIKNMMKLVKKFRAKKKDLRPDLYE